MPIEARLYDATGHDTIIELGRDALDGVGAEQLVWVDSSRDEESLAELARVLELGDGMGSLPAPSARPALARGNGIVRVHAYGLRPHAAAVEPVAVDFYARRDMVVSIHDGDVDGLDAPIRQAEGETRLGHLDSGTFLALLLDELLGGYFDAVEGIEERIDQIDVVALRAGDPQRVLDSMVALRREIARLRRSLAPQRAVFSSLTRPDAELDAELLGAAWPGLAQRFQLAMDAIENARELLVGSFEILMTRTGQRTNDVMRVLTVISAVLLPTIVLAGVMGMNFKLGFFDTANNFFVVVLAMLALAAAILLAARRRRWL
jgi:Mg2+ and Co2+ transporter CorA